MLDHIFFPVSPANFDAMVDFYVLALAPIGFTKQLDKPGYRVGFGPAPGNAPFWITVASEDQLDSQGKAGRGVHLAFRATAHATVDAFYEEAIKAGGKDDGKPGLRPFYHPDYYAAYVLDPLGNSIEVVDYSPRGA
ncbi:putative lactoylglutathione lyase [Stipitochalara longipes BDJ]|nr:putative lactoylglutathione lyase [Stipitochalara longipes BDJ]